MCNENQISLDSFEAIGMHVPIGTLLRSTDADVHGLKQLGIGPSFETARARAADLDISVAMLGPARRLLENVPMPEHTYTYAKYIEATKSENITQ